MKQSQNNRVVPIVVLAFFQAVFFQMIASQLNAQESKEAEQPFPVAMTVASVSYTHLTLPTKA